jgi:hypothetical protein
MLSSQSAFNPPVIKNEENAIKHWENTRSTLTWIDAERNLQFTLMAALNETDILNIAESVSLVKMTK